MKMIQKNILPKYCFLLKKKKKKKKKNFFYKKKKKKKKKKIFNDYFGVNNFNELDWSSEKELK